MKKLLASQFHIIDYLFGVLVLSFFIFFIFRTISSFAEFIQVTFRSEFWDHVASQRIGISCSPGRIRSAPACSNGELNMLIKQND